MICLKNKIVKRIKEIVSSGVFESIQEQSAGIAHDAIEANVYNPDLNVEDGLYGKIVDLDPSAFGDIFTSREATVSAAAGSFQISLTVCLRPVLESEDIILTMKPEKRI